MPLKLIRRPDSPVWYAHGTVVAPNGQRRRIKASTGCHSREDAKRAAADIERRALAGLSDKSVLSPALTFAEAAELYLRRPEEIRPFDLQRIAILADHVGDCPVASLDGMAWQAFIDKVLPGRKPATLNRWRATLLAVLHHARRRDPFLIVPDIPAQIVPRPKPRFLNWDEAERLLAAYHPALQPLATILCFQGARLQEALQLDWSAVDLERRWIRFTQGKGRRGSPEGVIRTVPMHDRTYDALRAINRDRVGRVVLSPAGEPYPDLRRRGGSPIKTAHRGALRRAGVQNFKIHAWRSHWASWMVMEAGADAHALMQLGGWTSERSVRHYVELSPDHLRTALSRLKGGTHAPGSHPQPAWPGRLRK